jgi:hypothetical protein
VASLKPKKTTGKKKGWKRLLPALKRVRGV